jgi:hypothetical protein
MRPEAQIVHRLPGRVRLRISGKRNDTAYFSKLAEMIRACPGVGEARVNPLTGSLIVWHEGPFEVVAAYAEARQMFRVTGPSPAAPLRTQVAEGLEDTSRNLEAVTGGELDLDGMLIVGLTGLAIQQAIEGNIMAPAVTLLWYALHAARGTRQDRGAAAGIGQPGGGG